MDAFEIVLLFDCYGGMLTEKQREYIDMRYNQDLSLGEIAQIQGVSRQAVYDNLNRTEALLRRMEEHIGALRRDLAVRKSVQIIMEAASVLEQQEDAAVQTLARQILAAARDIEE